ncbi:reverse transcriptase domain-containing protein [Delftia tsuruhatensis]|uniref:reverse transcriptase domain-containing protein n=1 Tax=Delftia tsuruhatensis TaxID=180282 RepID=UPI0009E6D8F3|nr:reverse transcriptase domain-containing protein [Delftia tsuruhatensis]
MSTQPTPQFSIKKQRIDVLFEAMFHGKWSFGDFVSASVQTNTISKSFTHGGRTRNLLVPSEKLKSFHEFLRLFLLDFLPFNEDVVFSYRKGMSAYDAVIKHAASKSFFVCDIANFFPSIKRDRIRTALLRAKECCPIEDLESVIERILDLVCTDSGLPQGFSTSPVISNSVLLDFDNAFHAYALGEGLEFTRYSDDIIISSRNSEAIQGIEAIVSHCLHDTMGGDFSLHYGKSRLLHSGVKIKLLGMVLLPNGKVSVDANVKDEIEVLIHFYLHDRSKFADKVDGDTRKAEARLSGLINYVNTIDQSYLDKLRRKFGVTVVDYFLHRSFS